MRNQHPFYMYDSIHKQPEALQQKFINNKHLSKLIDKAQNIFLVGTGTSYHAAWSSQFILRAAYPKKQIQAISAIDFALYEPDTKPDDLVILFSHRGTKQHSIKSLERAKKNGSKTALITGIQKSANSLADVVAQTVDQEMSSAHTISYMASIGVIAKSAGHSTNDLAYLVSKGLESETKIKELVKKVNNFRKAWIVGAGPAEVLAHEIALKIKETSYLDTEGVGTEELLHGPFQAAHEDDLFIIIAPQGKSQDRTYGLLPAINDIGAEKIVIGDNDSLGNDVVVPTAKEEFVPFNCLPPLQLLTYYLAIERGTNPDSFRLDNKKFKAAFERNLM